jgi:ubiquitin carboxyl-terminal hydrolase 14
MTVMMMGRADEVFVEAPANAPKFVEDLPEEEQNTLETKAYGSGLKNLGNTCYMNSTVQCLYSVQGLRDAVLGFNNASSTAAATAAEGAGAGGDAAATRAGSSSTGGLGLAAAAAAGGDSGRKLLLATQELFRDLQRGGEPFPPFKFLLTLRQRYPQFAQQTNEGFYMQQDAEECWTNVVYTLKEQLKVRAVCVCGVVCVWCVCGVWVGVGVGACHWWWWWSRAQLTRLCNLTRCQQLTLRAGHCPADTWRAARTPTGR